MVQRVWGAFKNIKQDPRQASREEAIKAAKERAARFKKEYEDAQRIQAAEDRGEGARPVPAPDD